MGITLCTDLQEHRLEIAQAQEDTRGLLRLAAEREEQLIEGSRQLLIASAQLYAESGDNPAKCSEVFNKLLKHYPSYANLGVVQANGDVFCSAIPFTQPVNLVNRAWFQEVVQRRSFTVSRYPIGPISGKPGIVFSYPMVDRRGQIQSVVCTFLDLAWFKQLAAEIDLPGGAVLQVIDRSGTPIARHPSPLSQTGKFMPNVPAVKAMLAAGEDVRKVRGPDGVVRLYSLAPVGSGDDAEVYMAIAVSKDDLFVKANHHLIRNLVGLGLAALSAITTAWIGGNLFLHPLQVLVRAVQRIAAGDLSARTGLLARQGELGRLAFAFDQMAETLEQRETQLERQAFYDPLTQLPNRSLFMDRLEHVLQRARCKDDLFAVLLLDLDRFKMINDSLGHGSGDQLLIEIAHRLKTCLRPGDAIARFGGDEFTILLETVQDLSDVIAIVEHMQKQLVPPFNFNGHEIFTTASVGIALSRLKVATSGGLGESVYCQPEDLLRDADTAMYRAKELGGGRCAVFDTAMHTRVINRWQLETSLRQAMEHQEFVLHYQPIVLLATSQVVGFEALVRWNHPQRGLVHPVEFISVIEEMGLIQSMGQWVLHEACRQMRTWREQIGLQNAAGVFPTNKDFALTISVNLSCKQLLQPNLVEQIQQVLRETNLPTSVLKLELTESLFMESSDFIMEQLLQLRSSGIQLYVDDFGTGYSSLSRLQNFPLHALKIDQTFIKAVGTHQGNAGVVQAIVTLAHSLQLDLVAEGIESASQVTYLQQLGCKYGQGYFFSRPLDGEAAGALIGSSVTGAGPTKG